MNIQIQKRVPTLYLTSLIDELRFVSVKMRGMTKLTNW